ncbi:uncharacterized protein LOC107609831 [Arachis ipaensis]|uniref:uncharacterized protein LOC107609831 n=1 Tax=Arachis ipaensis TaxID=130454 RepID=UPI000A2B3143|nr:uncharacterized protein LOC107609831 [Arachis ipaensis]XP_025668691.1 uncharacterized protein LOC112767022 [Arachis hypogaea]
MVSKYRCRSTQRLSSNECCINVAFDPTFQWRSSVAVLSLHCSVTLTPSSNPLLIILLGLTFLNSSLTGENSSYMMCSATKISSSPKSVILARHINTGYHAHCYPFNY